MSIETPDTPPEHGAETAVVDAAAEAPAPPAPESLLVEPAPGEPVAEPEAELEPEAEAEPEPEPEPEPEVEPEPEPEPDAVLEALQRIEAKLGESQRLIDRQAEVSAKLHNENQDLRAGELRKAQQGLVFAVLRVYDDVRQMAVTTEDGAARRDLELVAESLVDALERNGVQPTDVQPGEPFDAKRHKIARIEATADPAADRTVGEVVRPGFAWAEGDTVRVSEVTVHKYTAPAPEAEVEPETESGAPATP